MNKRILIYSNNAFIFWDFYYPIIKTLLNGNKIILIQSNYGLSKDVLNQLNKLKKKFNLKYYIIDHKDFTKVSIKPHLKTKNFLIKISKLEFDNIFLPTDTEIFTRYIVSFFENKKIFLIHSNILDPNFFNLKKDKLYFRKILKDNKFLKIKKYFNYLKYLKIKFKNFYLKKVNNVIFPVFVIGKIFKELNFKPSNTFTCGLVKNIILFDNAEKKALEKLKYNFKIQKIIHPSNYYYQENKLNEVILFIAGNNKKYNLFQEKLILKLCNFLTTQKKIKKIDFKLHPRSKNKKILDKINFKLSKLKIKCKILKNSNLAQISKNYKIIITPISNATRVAKYSSSSNIYCLVNCYDENLNEDKKLLGEINNIKFIKFNSDIKKKFTFSSNLNKKNSFKKEFLLLLKNI